MAGSGGTPLSEVMREARRILIDEGPQTRSDLIRRVTPFVPPGKAYRKWSMRNGWRSDNRWHWTDAQKIASGARTIIDGSLHSAEQRGLIRIYEQDGELYVAITDWGKAQFERYHRRAE